MESEVLILDCMTLLATNLLMQFVKDDLADEAPFMEAIRKEADELLSIIHEGKQDWLIISNEVGLGLVPPYPIGRVYRDGLGWANQRLAHEANEVFWMVAGIPVPIGQYR